jgi:bifunctional non-homologous end joining protein LigD
MARRSISKGARRSGSASKPAPKSRKPAASNDALRDYQRKRDFSRTAEPKPAAKRGKREGWQFVVQKHDARRVHYDLRLELGGTLKSWAVTRGPSLIAGEKRLAVRTEDHPMQYLDFEGNIPKGEYGGGAMIVWDRGRWESAFDPEFGLQKGHLDITLHGARLSGRWHLVRMKPRRGEKTENWLFIKAEDEFARRTGEVDITDEETTSAVSGRTTDELAAEGDLRKDHAGRAKVIRTRTAPLPDPKNTKGARKGILPAFLEPSLADTTSRPPSGRQWVHEIKYDGYRTQARIDGATVQLLTRTGLDWTKRFSPIAAALKDLGLSAALIDGEIVVEDEAGIASFNLLQADLEAGRTDRFRYYMFDLLYGEGYDLTKASLGDRKALLHAIAGALPGDGALRFSEHFDQDGPTLFEHASRLGLEGIVSKRIDLPYRAGRGSHWLKSKAVLRQEFVILGYVPSTAATRAVGALLVGYYEGGNLNYAGRVGTGFSAKQAHTLYQELERRNAKKPALVNKMPAGSEKAVRWAKPELVGEVEFRGWTGEQLIRQSSFKGLREDRPAVEVVREGTLQAPAARRGGDDALRTRLTHPERILWPAPGITKQGLAEFYSDIADWILPHIRGRVLSLMRCPSGVQEKCFFAKHAWQGLSSAVHRVDVGETDKMLVLDDIAGLIELVQAGVVEIHPWGSTFASLEKPDRLTFDLDPDEGVPWSAMIAAATEVRDRLADLGLKSFVKTTGGKGLHVMVPIAPSVGWDAAKAFTQDFAEAMAKQAPDKYVAVLSKKARRGRIFVDYLRNGRGQTAVAAYSTRQRANGSVSTPLAWEELSDGIRADHFKIDNLRQRLDVLKVDPWREVFTLKQKLPKR